MMAGGARQPVLLQRLDARGVLEAVLPCVAVLCFCLAVLFAVLDELSGQGAAADPATLAPVMSTGQAAPAQ
jgi:hypothetical protein